MREIPPDELLPGQLFVLLCRPGKNRIRRRQEAAYVVRAGVLGQLLVDGHLVDMDGVPERAMLSRLTDPVLDSVAGEIAGDRSRKWRPWLRRRARPTFAAVQQQLIEAGIIRTEPRKVLGMFPRTTITPVDPELPARLRARVDQALRGSVPAQDTMLAALVVAGDLRWVISRSQRRAHADRIKDLLARSAPVAPTLARLIRSSRAAAASAGAHGGG
ncbi:MAG TPA: GPP34 family phosphoprotein [Mycobacteriales bacterium]|nr:GPP34 family phosphoprotein [Mycobacteriales bacterium]